MAIMVNETVSKFVALHELAQVNGEVCDMVRKADTAKALYDLLPFFELIPCGTKKELGKFCWEQFVSGMGVPEFKEFDPYINYAACGEDYFNSLKEEHEIVHWASTGVIYSLD